MDMIERVARALFQRDVEEDVCDGTWEDNVALHDRILADARAAIEAMREPMQEMLEVGEASPYTNHALRLWRSMIDVALRD